MKFASAAALLWAASGAGLAADAPQEAAVVPVAGMPAQAICVIENPEVSADFLAAYKAALEERGLKVSVLTHPENFYNCPMTSTYVAFWQQDAYIGFIYSISYAKFSVYRDGRRIGYATFQRPNGYVMNKAENKVRDLVSALFPGGAR